MSKESNMKMLNPQRLNKFYTYILTLKSLIKMVNDFNSCNVDIIRETNRIPGAVFQMQEILFKIFELVPLKVDMQNSILTKDKIDIRFRKMNENAFDSDVQIPYISQNIEQITEKNKHFYFYNYFARNILVHQKHFIESPGQLGSHEGITTVRFELEITKSSKSYSSINKWMNNSNELTLFHKEIHIKKRDEGYFMEIWLDRDFMNEIAYHISNAYIKGMQSLLTDLSNIGQPDEKLNGIKLSKYKDVLETWIDKVTIK